MLFADYRKSNRVTVWDFHPILRMGECINSLGDSLIFSTLDPNRVYWQVYINHIFQDKTAFTLVRTKGCLNSQEYHLCCKIPLARFN